MNNSLLHGKNFNGSYWEETAKKALHDKDGMKL